MLFFIATSRGSTCGESKDEAGLELLRRKLGLARSELLLLLLLADRSNCNMVEAGETGQHWWVNSGRTVVVAVSHGGRTWVCVVVVCVVVVVD